MTISTVSSNTYQTVVLGNGTYSTSLTVESGVTIEPSTVDDPGAIYVGVTTDKANSTLTNDGCIHGSGATTANYSSYDAGNGAVAVVLDSSKGSLSNSGDIFGGCGGNIGYQGTGAAGNGADGVDLSGGAKLGQVSEPLWIDDALLVGDSIVARLTIPSI